MIGIKYAGVPMDHSGYGSANRAFITSLFIAGVNVTMELVIQVPEKTNYGLGEYISKYCQDRPIEYKIKIIHLTPDMYPRYKEEGKYNIGHLFWETDRLPHAWVEPCNKMEEIWTASDRMIKMLRSSGVTTPCYAFPQPCNTMSSYESIRPFEMKFKKDFIFYSVFQWIERKNPRTLLRSYWRAFEGRDDVTLLLKTYRVNYSVDEYHHIKNDIAQWKRELGMTSYPKVLLVNRLLKDTEMHKLHALGDVYVNPSSGEGWCRPLQEAMLYGKPVISADNGGITDYMTDEYYFRVPSVPTRVTEVSYIPWYTKDQHWWEIKEDELVRTFRHAYDTRESHGDMINKARSWVLTNTNYQTVGNQLKERLQQIERIL